MVWFCLANGWVGRSAESFFERTLKDKDRKRFNERFAKRQQRLADQKKQKKDRF